MQGLILAAGMGKRLKELTKDNTKCMVSVNGKTLIERVLSQLHKSGLNKVIIVIGYAGDKLRSFIGDNYLGMEIIYVTNEIYYKTNNIYSLYLAKDFLIEDDTILLESDLIFDDSLIPTVINHTYSDITLVAKYQAWMDGTVVTIDKNNNIVDFISKSNFNFKEIDNYYKTVNIYKFSKEFSRSHYVPFLNAYIKAMGDNEYYEQVLGVISHLEYPKIKALPLTNEKWYEIDDIQDLDIAETIFSEGEEKINKISKRYGGYWRFPELLDFCYLVNPFFPPKRMKKELKKSFDTLLTQYPSGLEINNLLAAKYFGIDKKNIIVGNGAAELINAYLNIFNVKTGVIYPTFEEYPNRLLKENIIPYYPKNNSFSYTVDELINFYTDKDIKQLILINPDNPSGNFINYEKLFDLINWSKKKEINLVIDESFVDFSGTGDLKNSLLKNEILNNNDNIFIVKSISKSFGVPGLRLGIIASSNHEIINKLKKTVSIWNINSFAEYYMQIFSKYESQYVISCKKFADERKRFFNKLKNIHFLRVIPSEANYFLVEVKKPYNSKKIVIDLLNKYNILVKDVGSKTSFIDDNYLRIAIRDSFDNDKLIIALHELES